MSVSQKPLSQAEQQAIIDVALAAVEVMGDVDNTLRELADMSRRDE